MLVLAIDLGETTGYALVRTKTHPDDPHMYGLVTYGTCSLHPPDGKMKGNCPIHGKPKFKPDLVVIERPAYAEASWRERYDIVLHELRSKYKRVEVVRPADWMPRFNHYPLPGRGVLPTQHEKDAYRLARYALERWG